MREQCIVQKIGLNSSQIQCVNNAISCTGLESDLSKIPFASDGRRVIGYIVGTADFLGQMSDPSYLQKLPSLFNEYHEGGVPGYSSSEDLIEQTPSFFEQFVMKRLTNDFHAVYQYVANHLGGGIYILTEFGKISGKSRVATAVKASFPNCQPESL